MIRIKVGDTYEDCGYRPLLCNNVNYDEDHISGISLVDGQEYQCSIYHCSPTKIRFRYAFLLRDKWALGELEVLKFKGWSEEDAKGFIANWRSK